jgi:hypothetical protein
MTKNLPYLALDSAGERTILCDYGLPLAGGNVTTKKETKKMKKTMSISDAETYGRLFRSAAADRFFKKCMGQDAAMDDETVEKLKGFLKNKLTAEDHEQVCNMLAGDVEAQDTEPPPYDMPEKTFATGDNPPPLRPLRSGIDGLSARQRMQAADSFAQMFPAAARVRIDNSGIQPPARAASYSADGAASFAAMFPDAQRIRLL